VRGYTDNWDRFALAVEVDVVNDVCEEDRGEGCVFSVDEGPVIASVCAKVKKELISGGVDENLGR
jgi:hypothetical protein